MHIKQVVISGFRSFRHQSEIEPFSPKHNVIIGRNGSGKSNFFAAIQFVLLSQKFMHLRQDERQQLLHEGAGANVMSAFVEVIFDNSDGRMTVEGDEVVLRRTIGVKKDEFFLNRKRVTKQEVSSLLESAGFSRSNPYYIVQQGKVNTLTLMKDEHRLDLLKEVAGTKVYEERRQESLQIINETNNKREKIQEVVAYIDERLHELEEEKEELKAYQQLDKDRRALEYTLYDKELKQARDELARVEEHRLKEIERSDDVHRQLNETRDALAQLESQLTVLGEELDRKEEDRGALEGEREGLIAEREKAVNEEKDLQEKVAHDEQTQEQLKADLKKLEKEIATVRRSLEEEVEPEYQEAKAKVEALTNELQEREALRTDLFDKQGRRSAFRSVEERDKHVRRQMEEIKESMAEREGLIKKNEAEREKHRKSIRAEEAQMEKKGRDIAEKEKALAALGEDRSKMLLLRSEKQDERKKKQERVSQLEEEKIRLSDKLRKAEQGLKFSMPKHIAHGLENIERLVQEERVKGYFGPVYDLIKLNDPKFMQAVEVAASNSLFNVVVDTDETAAKLLTKLEERNLGRVCFMPLNRLRVKRVTYPDSSDVVPLLKAALTYPKEVDLAMQQIFGQKLLARDLDVATRFADSADLDCITLDGDEASRKGSMQGGYHDEKQSRLAHVMAIREAKAELQPLDGQLAEEEKAQAQLDQEVSKMLSEMQKKERDAGNLKSEVDTLSRELRAAKQRIEMLKANIEKIETSLPSDRNEVELMRKQYESLKSELGTSLDGNLTAAESRTLQEIEARLPELQKQIKAAEQDIKDKKTKRMKLKYRLDENLTKRMSKVLEELTPENGGSGHSIKMEMVERRRLLELKHGELQQMARKVQVVEAKLKKMDQETERQRGEERQLKLQIEDRRAEEGRLKGDIAEVAKAQEKLINKRGMALQKRDSSLRKIQELGSLPAAELELYKNYGIRQLYKQLHECNEKLKKYSHVNKKALDQYVNFSDQREELLQRKKELDEGGAAIEKLINNLDHQKDEAILRTFRGVSKHFQDVFKELVPNGYGRMVMKTTADKTRDITDDADEEDAQTGGDDGGQGGSGPLKVSECTGVQIQVSFTGQGDRYLMQQLSGGQKALVALALIFSIQRCDPAPFYLFDEVDQALDSTYRAAVAAVIQRQANSEESPAQFITTTFRPELVRVADRCYGISHQNKVSAIDILEKQVAMDFVRELQDEEEALQKVAKPGGRGKSRGGKRKSSAGRAKGNEEEEEEVDQQQQEEEEGRQEREDGEEEAGEDQEEQEDKPRRKSSVRGRKRKSGE